MSNPLVRAIDIGYGQTKLVTGRGIYREMSTISFPSRAPLASKIDGKSYGRDTQLVEVKGVLYEVGKDVEDAARDSDTNIRSIDYVDSATYNALFKGALHYIGEHEIELLVLGLPVSVFDDGKTAAQLQQRFTGPVRISNERTVHIHDIWVVPQPLGGLFDFTFHSSNLHNVKGKQNLIIDPGFYTLDWYGCNGIEKRTNTCGSIPGGVSAYLQELADNLSRHPDINMPLTNLARFDQAVRSAQPLQLFGKPWDLSPFHDVAFTVIQSFVSTMAAQIGNGANIDNIILVGGGAELFKRAIQSAFPRHSINMLPDPQFSNVRGFQFAGEQVLRQRFGAKHA